MSVSHITPCILVMNQAIIFFNVDPLTVDISDICDMAPVSSIRVFNELINGLEEMQDVL